MNDAQKAAVLDLILSGGSRGPCPQAAALPFTVGKNYYIETATKYWLGRCADAGTGHVTLERAAWIADTGRFADFMKSGTANEVEPVGGSITIAHGGIIAYGEWSRELLEVQK